MAHDGSACSTLPQEASATGWNPIAASKVALRTSNPIRNVVDQLKIGPNPPKPVIPLSLGDPAVFGNLPPPDSVSHAIAKSLQSGKFFGYAHACGHAEARSAVARRYTSPEAPLTEHDVVITSGCSQALEIVLTVLANENDNVLLPRPGFPLYSTICTSKGIDARFYSLVAERGWEANIDEMRSLIDSRTRAILVNNPSNPCGSVYSQDHLRDILRVAEDFHIPLIADEIYGEMVFDKDEHPFHPMARLTTSVPILTCSGIAKQYLVPGVRLGWILIHDRNGLLQQVRDGIFRLATLIVGANTLVQGALDDILNNTAASHYMQLNSTLAEHARFTEQKISGISGLQIFNPQGAMYIMVRIDTAQFRKEHGITDDVTFSKLLLEEESVIVLPGTCFGIPNYFRIVICPPREKLEEAYKRIDAFCRRHHI